MLKTFQLIFIILTLSIGLNADATLKGPREIIKCTWGNNRNQFHFWEGESHVSFPQVFAVDKNDLIIIPDPGNKRIVIYNQNGTIKNIVSKPPELPDLDNLHKWPTFFRLNEDDHTLAISCDYKKTPVGRGPTKICFISYSGELLRKSDIADLGKLLQTDAVPPAIRSTPHEISEDWYKESRSGTVEFNDKEEFVAEYGSPVEAFNGDVYIWKRTPIHHSILKWTWIDDEKVKAPQH